MNLYLPPPNFIEFNCAHGHSHSTNSTLKSPGCFRSYDEISSWQGIFLNPFWEALLNKNYNVIGYNPRLQIKLLLKLPEIYSPEIDIQIMVVVLCKKCFLFQGRIT